MQGRIIGSTWLLPIYFLSNWRSLSLYWILLNWHRMNTSKARSQMPGVILTTLYSIGGRSTDRNQPSYTIALCEQCETADRKRRETAFWIFFASASNLELLYNSMKLALKRLIGIERYRLNSRHHRATNFVEAFELWRTHKASFSWTFYSKRTLPSLLMAEVAILSLTIKLSSHGCPEPESGVRTSFSGSCVSGGWNTFLQVTTSRWLIPERSYKEIDLMQSLALSALNDLPRYYILPYVQSLYLLGHFVWDSHSSGKLSWTASSYSPCFTWGDVLCHPPVTVVA